MTWLASFFSKVVSSHWGKLAIMWIWEKIASHIITKIKAWKAEKSVEKLKQAKTKEEINEATDKALDDI